MGNLPSKVERAAPEGAISRWIAETKEKKRAFSD